MEGADAMVEALRHAYADTMYELGDPVLTDLRDDVVLASAYLRRSEPAGGHSARHAIWLCLVQDGLFVRSSSFATEEAARAAFAQAGQTRCWSKGFTSLFAIRIMQLVMHLVGSAVVRPLAAAFAEICERQHREWRPRYFFR